MNSYPADWYHRLPTPVKEIFTTLQSHGHNAYLVGGSVRDFLLHKEPKDFDLVTNAKPEEIARYFPKTVDVGRAFGIMVVVMDGMSVELASFRKDGDYEDSRRPETIEFASPEEDAIRRDFTMNGLFWDPQTRTVIDFVSGMEDIRAHHIRAIGDAGKRFQEDALRMLRALRFYSQLEAFSLDEKILTAISANKERLLHVSRERITAELNLILKSKRPSRAFAAIEKLGILSLLFPELPLQDWLKLDELQAEDSIIAWAYLLQNGRAPAKILFSKEEKEALRKVPKLLAALNTYATLSMAEKKDLLAEKFISIALKISTINGNPCETAERDQIRWEHILFEPPLVTGKDLAPLGIQPGKAMGELLQEIRVMQRNEILKTKEAALDFAKKSTRDERS